MHKLKKILKYSLGTLLVLIVILVIYVSIVVTWIAAKANKYRLFEARAQTNRQKLLQHWQQLDSQK